MDGATALAGIDTDVRRLVTLARVCLEADLAFLAAAGDEQRMLVVDGDVDGFAVFPGYRIPMRVSLCHAMLAGSVPRVLADTHAHPVARSIRAVARHGVRSYAGTPVLDADGEPVATLCVASHTVDDNLHTTDARFLAALARGIGPLLTVPPDDRPAPEPAPTDLDDLDHDARHRIRLSLEVGARLGLDAAGLTSLAADAATADVRPDVDHADAPLGERIAAVAQAYQELTAGVQGSAAVVASEARSALLRGAGTRWCAISATALVAVVSAELGPDGGWLTR